MPMYAVIDIIAIAIAILVDAVDFPPTKGGLHLETDTGRLCLARTCLPQACTGLC